MLDRIARALMLTDVEREHLFLLGLGRPPEVRYQQRDGVTPRLQRVLDALELSPAHRSGPRPGTSSPGTARPPRVLTDYGALPPRAAQHPAPHLLRSARPRRAVRLGKRGALRGGRFRATPHAPARPPRSQPLVDELCRLSPEFEAMWRDNDVAGPWRRRQTPAASRARPIAFEYSAFAVDARPDLSMVVYNPATPADRKQIASLVDQS